MDSGHCGPGGPPGPEIGFGCASFNQDSTSLALGTKTGYKLFSLTSVDNLDCIYESHSPDVCLVERLFGSSLVVVVSSQMPQRMNIYHFKKGTEICNYSYPQPVRAVKLNRQRLVVCLEESIYIHNIKDMKLLKTLLNIPSNPSGLCALSVSPSSSYLAYPSSASIGEVLVYDANALSAVSVIPAHHSPLAAFSFDASASRLASASQRGTVIRVFSIPRGHRLFEFRRGLKRFRRCSPSWSGGWRERHIMDWDNAEIIGLEDNEHRCWIKEPTEIWKRAHRTINRDKGAFQLSRTWDTVLKKSDCRWRCSPTTSGGRAAPDPV